MNDFRDNFQAFCRLFNNDRSYIIPLISINSKTVDELVKTIKKLIETNTLINHICYILDTSKPITYNDMIIPLQKLQVLSVAPALRLFKKPNHKDRYIHMINFLLANPQIFAQIIYLNALQLKSDDICYFSTMTFPSLYLYFMTHHDQKMSIELLNSISKLHIYLHSQKIDPKHQFITDLFYGYFISTHPGEYFQNSILPLIPKLLTSIEKQELKYSDKTLVRIIYWNHMIIFVKELVDRLTTRSPLFPNSAKLLLKMIKETFPSYYKIIIIKYLICRYINNYFPKVNNIYYDATMILNESVGLDTYLSSDMKDMVKESNIDIERLIDKISNPHSLFNNKIDDAVEMSGRVTLITPRSLSILHKLLTDFQSIVEESNIPVLTNYLCGISEPKNPKDDLQYIQLRVSLNDSSLMNTKIQNTQPYDEIVEIINLIDLGNESYNSAEELQQILFTNCRISEVQKQLLSIENLKNYESALQKIFDNKRNLSSLNEKLASTLFITQNEIDISNSNLEYLTNFLINEHLFLSLTGFYPSTLAIIHNDIFSPKSIYVSLVHTTTKFVSSLNLNQENSYLLQKKIFLDFLDQIDLAFEFQKKVKTDKMPMILSEFCQMNTHLAVELSPQKQRNLSKAAIKFQYIKPNNRVSYNLQLLLDALKNLESFSDDAIMLTISISGNIHIFGFVYFMNSYIHDSVLSNLIFTENENRLLEKMRKSTQILHDNIPYKLYIE
ncbi:hypothetical protein TRFO_18861 [Tritrichomonas foetus]|uniref:Uncharacterized protein n=1 Tax=Tritrichomonas foetus TaxID=1144522 RepID=A0A1J4KQ94_9EUKA|nr:hypothetical protein TRFO_18861 [Tritrichomonas foetus]|eukprot:OHT11605.1 hypothetical protein TRFO_18861 [Tritrichomonas foetus]